MNQSNGIITMNVHYYIEFFRSVFHRRKSYIIFFSLLLFILLFSFGMISTKVTAGRSDSRVKLVTSVKIEKGDSLWSIAEEYFTDDYADINTYIKEIKRSNGLTSDIIHEDCYIIVPYYTD